MAAQPQAFPTGVEVILVLRRTLTWNKHEEPAQAPKDWLPFPQKLHLPFRLKEGRIELGKDVDTSELSLAPATLLFSLNLNTRELEVHALQANQSFASAPLSLSEKSGKMELHFQWNYFTVGDPERDAMKVGELETGKSLEFRVNGKRDFSLSSRRDRSYLEQSYWLQHLGTAVELIYSKDDDFPTTLPKPDKLVDLRKLLW